MKRADIERCRAAGESIRDDAQAIKRAVRTLAATVLFLLCPIPFILFWKSSLFAAITALVIVSFIVVFGGLYLAIFKDDK